MSLPSRRARPLLSAAYADAADESLCLYAEIAQGRHGIVPRTPRRSRQAAAAATPPRKRCAARCREGNADHQIA